MVVPTVLGIIARRNCARCSASGNGLAVMSNVVILPLPGPYQTGALRNALRSPSTEVDEGVDVCFLVGWGCAVIARSRPCRLGKPVLDSERLPPNAITGAGIPNDTVLQIENVVPRSAGKLDLGLRQPCHRTSSPSSASLWRALMPPTRRSNNSALCCSA